MAGLPRKLGDIREHVNQHIEYADEHDELYPHLLLIAGNDNTEADRTFYSRHTGGL